MLPTSATSPSGKSAADPASIASAANHGVERRGSVRANAGGMSPSLAIP